MSGDPKAMLKKQVCGGKPGTSGDTPSLGLRCQDVPTGLDMIDAVSATAGGDKDTTRFTVYVPKDKTLLSLGAASSGHQSGLTTDAGMTLDTHEHIRLETRTGPRTEVVLGKKGSGHRGDGLVTAISGDAQAGYSMATDGNAWHEAKHQHAVVSRQADVVVRTAGAGQSAVLHADKGKVSVAGKEHVVVGSPGNVHIGAKSGEDMEVREYNKGWTTKVGSWVSDHTAAEMTKWAQVVKSIGEVVGTFAGLVTSPQEGKAGFAKRATADLWVGRIADIAGLVADSYTAISSPPKEGAVTISGNQGVMIGSGKSTTIFGTVSSSMAGGVAGSVMGNVIASVHGVVAATVASVGATTLRAQKDVEVRADWGGLLAHGNSNVTIACESGPLIMGGKSSAQLVSDGTTWLYGDHDLYLGNAGYRLTVDKNGFMIGSVKPSDSLDAPVKDKPYIIANKGMIGLYHEDSVVSVLPEQILIETNNGVFGIKKHNVTVDAKGKVLLG